MRSRILSMVFLVAGLLMITTACQASLAGPMDSTQFVYKYEADAATPDIEDAASGWTMGGNTTASVSGGQLHYSSTEAESIYWNSATFTNTVTASTSYTVEVRAKVLSSSGTEPGLAITPASSNGKIAWLSIAHDALQWEQDGVVNDVIAVADNASDFHVFRMAYDASNSQFQIWRDGVLVGQNLLAGIDYSADPTYKRLALGDGSSTGAGTVDIDYIRWDITGAYSPVPEPTCMALLAASALFLRRKK